MIDFAVKTVCFPLKGGKRDLKLIWKFTSFYAGVELE